MTGTPGVAAANLATAVSAGSITLMSAVNTIPIGEFVPGTLFAAMGALGWQFIRAQAAREDAAAKGIPARERPTIDIVTCGYSLFGAPLVSGALIALIHAFGGTANLLSLGGFIIAGAAGPRLVQPVIAMFLNVLPKQNQGDKT